MLSAFCLFTQLFSGSFEFTPICAFLSFSVIRNSSYFVFDLYFSSFVSVSSFID